MDITSIGKFYIILQHAICETNRQKMYAQNKDAATLHMKEYREKKKDLIQLSKKECYTSNEHKIKNSMKDQYEDNKSEKKSYDDNKDARKLYSQEYYVENKDAKRQYYEENKNAKRQYYEENKVSRSNFLSKL